jgi:hypothetical protein
MTRVVIIVVAAIRLTIMGLGTFYLVGRSDAEAMDAARSAARV